MIETEITYMTEKQRLIKAMNREQTDRIPHFELVFDIPEQVFGKSFNTEEQYYKTNSWQEHNRMINKNINLYEMICEKYSWCACPMYHIYHGDGNIEMIKQAKKRIGDRIMVSAFNGYGTFGIPDGDSMLDFSYNFYDEPDNMKELAQKKCMESIELGKRQIDAGAELIIINTDYAFNANPFLAPYMFSEFVTPYLEKIVKSLKKEGAYVILHSDGNIMPILDDIASVGLDGLQSIDPQGGVDIAIVKKMYGDRLTLMGNVKCCLLQDGPENEIRESVRYAVKHGSPGGGYIFSSSNCIFKGMPIENYNIMLDEFHKLQW